MVINPVKRQHARVPRLVSVIIGAYNSARHVGETIDTMLAQTYRPLELIIVDDGSTDDTWPVLHSYGYRIVTVRQAQGGVPAARTTRPEPATSLTLTGPLQVLPLSADRNATISPSLPLPHTPCGMEPWWGRLRRETEVEHRRMRVGISRLGHGPSQCAA